MSRFKKAIAAALCSVLCAGAVTANISRSCGEPDIIAYAAQTSLSDMPSDYRTAADWIWTNRVETEGSMKDGSTVYDQIVAGNGTLNYILIWQSYEKITLEQRQKLPQMLEDAVNQWTDCLVGYDDWPFEHVNVKVVGYAVLDESCIVDRQPDEVVYTDTTTSWLRDDMISSGMGNESVPAIQPAEPTDLSRYVHWSDKSWSYNGSYENRYDMYLHGITGMINMGGYGYHYGQILSDQSVSGLIDGTTSSHILLHEMGHSFGFTDFYGGEGESDGFPPGGFPGGGTSIMMAGSSTVITDFDSWFTRYAWSKLKEESGRFDLSSVEPSTTATTTSTTTTTSASTTTTTTTRPITPGEGEKTLSVWAESNNSRIVDTDGSSHITVQVQGLPWAGVSGTYSYIDNATQTVTTESWMMSESLGDEGIASFGIEIPDNIITDQIKITVDYYAQWDDTAGDMVDKDPAGLVFSAVGSGQQTAAAATTSTTTTTTTTVTTTTTEPALITIAGDVNADGKFDIYDIIMMNQFILGEGGLTDWKAGDLNNDNIISIVDLCLMKRL